MPTTNDYARFLRTKQDLGASHGFEPVEIPDFLFPFQKFLVEWAIKQGRALIAADCGLGKGQPPSAKVLTPTGWREIGSILVGDRVIASNGYSATVVGVYPKPTQNTHRFWFSDGASLVVDEDHLHICRTNNDRQRGRQWRVMSTRDLIACGNLRYGTESKSRNYDIPVVADVIFDFSLLPVDPYVLGVLLGDGHLKGNLSISSADDEILHAVSARLPEGVRLEFKDRYDWKIMTGLSGTVRHPFRQAIADLGLLGLLSADKFIPDAYLFASPSERLMLLRGLMDTDGYISKEGCCQFYSVSEWLATGAIHLIRSLGGIPTLSVKETSCEGKPGQPCHIVTFSLATHNPFLLPRKAAKWNPEPRDNGRWIDRIEYEGRQETVCIAVDSEDQSYVTENFIVTHNTPMQLVWADNVVRETGKPVLIMTPLAVSAQTVREAEKFGIPAKQSRTGEIVAPITVTNYEQLHRFNPEHFIGAVADESAAIKSFNGKRRKQVVRFFSKLPYRLLCTATPSPNDFIELGTQSEALGIMTQSDMLGFFFRETKDMRHTVFREGDFWNQTRYYFKPHSEQPFWRWVSSWARTTRTPSDLGFDDDGFILPPLEYRQHIVENTYKPPGELFARPAISLKEQSDERKMTTRERAEKIRELVDKDETAIVACHLNEEGVELARIIPGAVEVAGRHSDDFKEGVLNDFALGNIRVLVSKARIMAWGMNYQNCGHITTFPGHSFEQFYQLVRRCWRFGRKERVITDIVSSPGESHVIEGLDMKMRQAERMFQSLIKHMQDSLVMLSEDGHDKELILPEWLYQEEMVLCQ